MNGQLTLVQFKIIYIVLQTSALVCFKYLLKKSSLATPNVENECWTSYETLESIGEMKLMMKLCVCMHKFDFLNFEIYFLWFPAWWLCSVLL